MFSTNLGYFWHSSPLQYGQDGIIGGFVGLWIGSGSSKLLNRRRQPKNSKNLQWCRLVRTSFMEAPYQRLLQNCDGAAAAERPKPSQVQVVLPLPCHSLFLGRGRSLLFKSPSHASSPFLSMIAWRRLGFLEGKILFFSYSPDVKKFAIVIGFFKVNKITYFDWLVRGHAMTWNHHDRWNHSHGLCRSAANLASWLWLTGKMIFRAMERLRRKTFSQDFKRNSGSFPGKMILACAWSKIHLVKEIWKK